MTALAALVPAPRADLCLEFADTLFWRGSTPPTETLHALDDVLRWSREAGGMPAEAVRDIAATWRSDAAKATAFDAAVALRETLYRTFSAAAAAKPAPAADLDRLNAALAAAPPRHRLQRRDGFYAWQVDRLRPGVAALLAPVLWSAGDLLSQPRLARVRQCANPKCRWLFLDDSKSGTRRWCAMSMCGNRAKAQRHYLRQKQG